MPRRGFRSRIRICGLCVLVSGPLLISIMAYTTYGAPIVTDMLFVYLFLLLPLGFVLLGYSVALRWLRAILALVFLASAWITLRVLGDGQGGEPDTAIQWSGAIYGPLIVGPGFVVAVLLGLIFVPRRISPGHCQKCAYNLHGLTEARCPECGTPFAPNSQQTTSGSLTVASRAGLARRKR